ncbi:MAG: alpha/beta fold hydrolase [Alphaproteobacteria bacterium]|nr:alpha/beta fold hydrolase [Alphaproteobacteria bacterium]
MKFVRHLTRILSSALLLMLLLASGFVWHYRDISADALIVKYSSPDSKFLSIDGVRFHYRDEGPRDAPAVLLVHAHWASLIMWDEWASALSNEYRVVRFDMAGHGLTGIDPSGDYTLERGVELLEKFNKALDLERFDIVGTSLGGTHAIHYTIKNPEHVDRLVLLNPGALNAGVRGRDTASALPWWIDALTLITPQSFFQFMLEGGYGDSNAVPKVVVSRWHELQMGADHRNAELERTRQYVSGDIVGMICSLSVPTLIMWGEDNPVVTVDQAYEFIELLENAPNKQLAIYPGLGHMAVLEDPTITSRDIKSFLDGTRSFNDHLDKAL